MDMPRCGIGPQGLCAIAGLLAACAQQPVGPYLQHVGQNSATVSWETDLEGDTWLEYGLTPAYGAVVPAGKDVGLHKVRLSGLESGTTYHYRVCQASAVSRDLTFQTAETGDSAVRFTVYGDTQANSSVHHLIANAMLSERPAFVLHVGDGVENGADRDAWAVEYFLPAADLMAHVPVYAALGNHEHNATWFYHYHAYPKPSRYYSFTIGGHLILVLDTNSDFRAGSAQQAWLRATLESQPARSVEWIWVVAHHPAYWEGWTPCGSDGNPAVREHLIPVLENHGIDAVFHGHVHGYERGQRNGVYYVTTGGGGGELDQHCQDWPYISVARYVHHYVTVQVEQGLATIRAKRADGTLIDEFRLTRRERSPQMLYR